MKKFTLYQLRLYLADAKKFSSTRRVSSLSAAKALSEGIKVKKKNEG